jgi:rhodanese-related sulfurtransferase
MKLLKEILFILIGASIIAFLFNLNQSKPLPLIKTEKIIVPVSDSQLFDNETTTTDIQKSDTGKNSTKTAIDTIKKKIENPNNPAIDKKPGIDSTKAPTVENNSAKSNLDKTITYEQLLKLLKNPKFLLIDARHEENYQKAKIGNAINIFPYSDEKEMINKILDLPKDKTLVIYCDGGNCDASHKLAEVIISFGYEKVFIYTGGWDEWAKKRGLKD